MTIQDLNNLETTKNILIALLNSNASPEEAASYQIQIETINNVIFDNTRPATDFETAMSGRRRMLKNTVAWHD